MDAQTVVSFVYYMKDYPKLKHDKKAFKKVVERDADAAFKIQKQRVFDHIKEHKRKLLECFDIYEKFIAENSEDLFDPDMSTDEMVERLIKEFNIDKVEEGEEKTDGDAEGTEPETRKE